MNKRFLTNFLKRKINLNLPSFSQEKTILGIWGRGQIKKLSSLGQELVIMRMEANA